METLFIPTENNFKRSVREAVHEYFQNTPLKQGTTEEVHEELVSRKEIAKVLKVSLVTLTDWVKRGLPHHKQRGRVYFIKSEVLEYIRENTATNSRFAKGCARQAINY